MNGETQTLDNLFSTVVFIGALLGYGFDLLGWQPAVFYVLVALYLRNSAIYSALRTVRTENARKEE